MANVTLSTLTLGRNLMYAPFQERCERNSGLSMIPLLPQQALQFAKVLIYWVQIWRIWWKKEKLYACSVTELPQLPFTMEARIVHHQNGFWLGVAPTMAQQLSYKIFEYRMVCRTSKNA